MINLPTSILQSLKHSDLLVFNALFPLFYFRLKQHPDSAIYITPSEIYLSKKTGLARETVSRSIQHLVNLGLIVKIQRRKIRGRWTTNLYKIGTLLKAILNFGKRFFFKPFHRVTGMSHIEYKGVNRNIIDNGNKGAASGLLLNKSIGGDIKDPELRATIQRLTVKMGF